MCDFVVKVKHGQLRGKKAETVSGMEYFSFSGVPYAQPPVGKLRFKDPEPPLSWIGIRDATKESQNALQCNFFTSEITGSDDCLYLNIHTPKLTPNDPLPVIVFIHGGGFVFGSAQVFRPDFLIEKDVVFVSINYRLGVMGFLCTDPENARGDMGLKDQSMALRWVKENIQSFSGDPDNVTILGMSSGGSSVEYHILSKMSQGLFHKAIVQSGSCLNPYARTVNGVSMAMKLAKALGYKSDDIEGLFDFINSFESEDILKKVKTIYSIDDVKRGNLFQFTPVVNEFNDGKGFIDGEPVELLKKGDFNKVPTISGTCNFEGVLSLMLFTEQSAKEIIAGKYVDYIPDYLKTGSLEEDIDQTYKAPNNGKDGMIDFLSDLIFNSGVVYSAEQRMKHGPDQYFYQFSYFGDLNKSKMSGWMGPGAIHGDDVLYLGPNFNEIKASQDDLIVRSNMVRMWTDFAKTGNPTPKTLEWLPLNEQFRYLNIDFESRMLKGLNDKRRKLWREIYDKICIVSLKQF